MPIPPQFLKNIKKKAGKEPEGKAEPGDSPKEDAKEVAKLKAIKKLANSKKKG